MKNKMLFILAVSLAAATSGFGQSKTVTNADLSKYKEKRLQAEREYRENYAKWGMPSPEELEQEREKSKVEREELSAKLRADRLEKERLEARRAEMEAEARARNASTVVVIPQADGSYIYSYGPYGYGGWGRGNGRYFNNYGYSQRGYFAGGQFWAQPQRPRYPAFSAPKRGYYGGRRGIPGRPGFVRPR